MKKILYVFLIIFVCSFFCEVNAATSEGDSDAGVKWDDSSLQTTLEKAIKAMKQAVSFDPDQKAY